MKVGDKVKILAHDAFASSGHGNASGRVGYITRIVGVSDAPYCVYSELNHRGTYLGFFAEKELRKVENMFSVGDIVTDGNNTRKVLAVVDSLTALSVKDDYDRLFGWYTENKLKSYKITDGEPTELTIDEIAKKFKLDPSQVRIKKED